MFFVAKKKEFERKATGGGPAILITPVEELVIEGIRNKPQLTGIPGGIETCGVYLVFSLSAISFMI